MVRAYRRAANVDKNQKDIVSALRCIPGVTVRTGVDDIFVGVGGRNFWFEIKSENAISKRTGMVRQKALGEDQKDLAQNWRGHYRIVSTLEEILSDMGLG